MNHPAPEQKKMMWIYIILLLVVIVGLWLFFLKEEIGLKVKETNNPSLGNILNEFKDSLSQGARTLKQVGGELRRLTSPPATATPATLNLSEQEKADLLQKVQEKLKESSVTSSIDN